jgi:hypothetical protein
MNDSNKKWLVIYNYGDNGSVYLNQKEYEWLNDAIKEANKTGQVQYVKLEDGTFITTSLKTVIPNPEWVDPKKQKAKEMFYRLRKDYLERRTRGENITWEEYKKEKRVKIKAEYEDFLKDLKNE